MAGGTSTARRESGPDRRGSGGGSVIAVREIELMLRDRIEPLVYELLPNARQDGHFLCVGSIAGEPGRSLKINRIGARKGSWTDFANRDAPDGHGDALHLIRHVLFNGDMGRAVAWAKSWLGIDDMDPSRLDIQRRDARRAAEEAEKRDGELRDQKRRRAQALWLGGVPIGGTKAEAYLRGRGIRAEMLATGWPGSLRFHDEVWNSETRLKIPAMCACMMTPDGQHVATHRTYLRWDEAKGWTKLDSPNAKMVLGACAGSFIPISKGATGKSMAAMPEGEPIYITEGIEDALTAAMARPALRLVAGYSLPNIGAIRFPQQAGPLVVLADRDPPGSKAIDALERAIARQQASGRTVKIVMPPPGQKDFNAWLLSGPLSGAAEGGR